MSSSTLWFLILLIIIITHNLHIDEYRLSMIMIQLMIFL